MLRIDFYPHANDLPLRVRVHWCVCSDVCMVCECVFVSVCVHVHTYTLDTQHTHTHTHTHVGLVRTSRGQARRRRSTLAYQHCMLFVLRLR
jgi:hypothetical protein